MKLSNAAVAAVYSTAFVITLSFLPEASAIPRGREAYYKWSPRYYIHTRADRKSQVGQHLGFCSADL